MIINNNKMSIHKNYYTNIWKNHLKWINDCLSSNESKTCTLEEREFIDTRIRKQYSFKIKFQNGKSIKCTNSAVARDLIKVVMNSRFFKAKTKDKIIIINMDSKFNLHIKIDKDKQYSPEKVPSPTNEDYTNLSSEQKVVSFPPIVDKQSKILILGTAPGRTSLKTSEYYAKPGNIFWEIIRQLFNNGKPFSSYSEKKSCLRNHHIALWDTLKNCKRVNSTDPGTKDQEKNDIDVFLKRNPSIKKIIFNGKQPAKNYKPILKYTIALSTSPANRKYSEEERIESWKNAFKI
ncbi:MAG: DNA-deoxyinosine glycosylase [Prevotella sp.]|nr:DNA-deoxyinosine glycosylase [Prevotella sp.]MCI1348943.1 DNA-deoxyinosine glycosylase [Prevotella sp.]